LSLLQGDAAGAGAAYTALNSNLGLAMAEHDLGHPAASKRALDTLIAAHAKDAQYAIATAYAWCGDRDQAFAWLDRAIAQRDASIIGLKFDPLLRGLREDARYPTLLKALKLPEK